MSTASPVERDERTEAVENASFRWAYLVLSYGLLAAVVSNDAHLLAVAGREGLEVVRPADVRA